MMLLLIITCLIAVALCAAIGWMGYKERREAERWERDGR